MERKCITTIVPELKNDKCWGKYSTSECTKLTEDNTFLNLKEGESLNDLILSLESRLREYANRIKNLEEIILGDE